MKAIKYLLIGALITGFNAPIQAQDNSKDAIQQATTLIKTKSSDTEKQIKKIAKKFKKDAEVLTAIGRAYLDAKDMDNADKYAHKAISSNKHYGEAYILLGDIESAKDNGGGASAWYEQATMFDPKNPEGYRRYAMVNSKTSPQNSVSKLEELRKNVPDYPVDIISAEIYEKAGNLDKALSYYDKVDKSKMKDFQLVNYSMDCFLKGNFEKSIAVAQYGQSRFPKNAALNRLLFFNNTDLKRYDEALKYADLLFNHSEETKITELDYLYYGHAYLGADQYDKAIAMFTKSLEANSGNEADKSNALKNLSDAYVAKRDYVNAAAKYQEFLKTQKEITASDYAGFANIYVYQAQDSATKDKNPIYDKAFQVYKELGEKFPSVKDYATLWMARISSYEDPDMKSYLAKPYYEQLESMLKGRTDLDETNKGYLLEATQYLGYYYFKTNDMPNAKLYWKRVLEMDPTNETAKKVLNLTKE